MKWVKWEVEGIKERAKGKGDEKTRHFRPRKCIRNRQKHDHKTFSKD